MILNSPYISGSLTVTGNTNLIGALTVTGSLAGTATSSSFAYTASSAVSAYTAASAVNATTALTASYATSFTVGGTLTAQTLVVQTITSSTDFVTGSTRFGSLLTNTHTFTGSMFVTGSTAFFAGNVGIGTTAPLSKLHVETSSISSGNILTLRNSANWATPMMTSIAIRDASNDVGAIGWRYAAAGGIVDMHIHSLYNNAYTNTNNIVMTVRGNGNVGIGTVLPNALLHVSGSGSGSLMQISSHVSSSIFFVSGSGNVGIGTNSPTANLQISGLSGLPATSGGSQRGALRIANTSNIAFDFGTVAAGQAWLQVSDANNYASNFALLLNPNGGNVGIGTSSPKTLLQINGGSGAYPTLGTNVTNSIFVGRNDGVIGMYLGYAADGNGWIQQMRNDSATAANLILQPSGGNVGIGTTSPSTVFHVNGSSSRVAIITTSGALSSGFYDAFQMLAANQTGGGLSLNVGKAESTNNLAKMVYFHSSDGSTSNRLGFGFYGADGLVNILASGNVGIGTTNPTAQLQVSSASGGIISINSTVTNTFRGLIFQNNAASDGTEYAYLKYNATSGEFRIYANPAAFGGFMSFYSNNAESMRLNSSGYLFIGATTNSGFSQAHRIKGPSATETTDIISIDGGVEFSGLFRAVSGANYNGAGTAIIIGRNSSTGRSINAGGTINASGADYAEYMTKAIDDNITKGDIVGVNSEGLLTNVFNDSISFVVKSTDPSYVGGDGWGSVDTLGKLNPQATQREKIEYNAKLEAARAKVDRIAFSGQVPCNVTGAAVGDYIIPVQLENGKIGGQAITNPTFEQYQISVGKVWKIMEDGRAWIAVKIG